MSDWWFDERVVAPLDAALVSVPVGAEVQDEDRCRELGTAIEGLFRREVKAQYASWPPESTTDGTRIDFCLRSSEDTLEVAGVTWIDFDGSVFPFRALLTRTANGSASVTAYIGEVDKGTGAPPRLKRGTLIFTVREKDGEPPVPELIVGRRQIPIAWTRVFEVL